MILQSSASFYALFCQNLIFLLLVAAYEWPDDLVTDDREMWRNEFQLTYTETKQTQQHLAELNFNSTWCNDWENHVFGPQANDSQYLYNIQTLCETLYQLSKDFMEKQDTARWDLEEQSKLRIIARAVVWELGEYNWTKVSFLIANRTTIPDQICYDDYNELFSLRCLDMKYFYNLKNFEKVFVNICEADWLNETFIDGVFKKICDHLPLLRDTAVYEG